ncbi:DNA polymerase III subunit gamma/tau [Pelagibacteraceae bacterium]|nr:DNA polymerase III subunit gamma/tau [Pelagibacteraceae bacterium]
MTEEKKYKVLARKYRPKKFEDLIGQELLVKILSNAINNDRLAHAYILTGVRGVGKTTTARLIAMSINCKNRDKKNCEPCGNCNSCKSTTSDSNLDVIEIDAASNTGVDDIREIIDNVKYKPVIGDYKIFIIDEVHMLSKSAFNALLKTLEEPPEHVKFIFATTEIKKVPITVLSRCQRFDLHRIENKILSDHLLKISKLENIDIDLDAISLIVRSADGSVRDGLSLLDQAITSPNEKVDSQTVISMLGLADREKIFNLVEIILEGDALGAINKYKELYELGADIAMIFDELLNVVHFLVQIKIAQDLKDDIYIPEFERNKGAELSSKMTLNNLNIIWQILFKGYQELQNSSHLYQHGEMIILRIIYLHDGPSPEDLIKKMDREFVEKEPLEKNLELQNEANESNKVLNFNENKKEISPKENVNIMHVQDFRHFVDIFFKNREGLLHTKLYNDVQLVSFKEGEVTLNTSKINDTVFNRTVAKLISKWTGRIWQIHSSTSNLGKSLNDEDIINQQKEIELMKNHPEVKKILNEFPESKIHAITELGEINDDEAEINQPKIKKEK